MHQLSLDIFDTPTREPDEDQARGAAQEPLDILSYGTYIVAFSGGKDSVGCVLHLLESGVPRERIELWHHEVDGREGSRLMDWPCTAAYCQAFADTFRLPIFFSWRMGGFEREMLREETPTAPVRFEVPGGEVRQVGGVRGDPGTRRRFPQLSGSLTTRWCSGALKIDVMAAAIRNQERLRGQRVLVVTGERADESACRANYAAFEPHRTDKRESPKLARHIDHYRPVHGWDEQQVWDIMARWRINPHPAYRLGWGRVSCAGCIFGSDDQWASLRAVNPAQFRQIASHEQAFGCTIRRDRTTVGHTADHGTPYPSITPALVAEALNPRWSGAIFLPPSVPWTLPAGAFGDHAGPM